MVKKNLRRDSEANWSVVFQAAGAKEWLRMRKQIESTGVFQIRWHQV